MTPLELNALRNSARRCRDEIKAEWRKAGCRKGKDYAERDAISKRIIREHVDALAGRFTLVQLLQQIGVLEGILEDR